MIVDYLQSLLTKIWSRWIGQGGYILSLSLTLTPPGPNLTDSQHPSALKLSAMRPAEGGRGLGHLVLKFLWL